MVGAGFAGLACARALQERGERVTVWERKPDVGAFVRTTGLLVPEAIDGLPRRFLKPIAGVRLYSPGLRSIELDRPGYCFYATDAAGLLRWLARGLDVRTGRTFVGPERGAFTIGADGPRSRVARAFGLGINRAFLIGIEAEFKGVHGVDSDRLHCFLDSDLAPGYLAWVVPGLDVTQVGLACSAPHRPNLDKFLSKISRLFDFTAARIVERRGGLIPIGGPVDPASGSRAVLIGDAAGWVSPLTGGGIFTALKYGRLAGEALSEGRPVAAPSFRFKRLLRAVMDRRIPNGRLDSLIGFSPFQALARLVFFHSRGLLSPAAWKDLARLAAGRTAAAQ